MRTYSVGPDELGELENEFDFSKYEWLVYWYWGGGYEGVGESVALGKDGLLRVKGLGHCSCYGPIDCWESDASIITIEEFFRVKDSIHDFDSRDEVKSKVWSLLFGG